MSSVAHRNSSVKAGMHPPSRPAWTSLSHLSCNPRNRLAQHEG